MATLKNVKLRTKIILSVTLLIFLLTAGLTTYTLVDNYRRAEIAITDFKEDEVLKVRNTLKNYVDIAYETLLSNYQKSTDSEYLQEKYGTRLKSIVEIAESAIRQQIDAVEKGLLTTSEAQARAIQTINAVRYDGGTGYIWINDTTEPIPKMIMHPTLPALDGNILNDAKFNSVGVEKKNLFVAFNEVCRENGEGFVQYDWPKPTSGGLSEYQPKLSYVKLIEEWDWIIGTGIYIDDAIADAKNNSSLTVAEMRYSQGSGYFWINDTSEPVPRMVMHPTLPDLDGQILDDPKFDSVGDEKKNLFVAFNQVAQKDGAGYVQYTWPKPTSEGLSEYQPKESYVRLFEPWSWIIGTGVYIDDINLLVEEKRLEAQESVRSSLVVNLIISAAAVVIAFVIMRIIINTVTRPILQVVEWSKELAHGDLTLHLDVDGDDEIGIQGRNLNAAVNSIKVLIGNVKTMAAEADTLKNDVAVGSNETNTAVSEISENLHAVDSQFEEFINTFDEAYAAVNQISSSISSLDMEIEKQVAAVTQSSASMEEMLASIKNVSETSASKGEAAENLIQVTISGQEKLSSMMDIVKEIGTSIDKVVEITTIINGVSERSNILSMNAAIEAAHAGESGKGFAVVAEEMRVLADSTSEHARIIDSTLRGNVDEIKRLVSMSNESQQAFGEIAGEVKNVAGALTEISHAMIELSQGSNEIVIAIETLRGISSVVQNGAGEMKVGSSAISNIFDSVKELSQSSSEAVRDIAAGTEEIHNFVNSLNGQIQAMVGNIEKIGSELNKFRT
jgi:methyl-accepting chemotaxis protein